MDSKVLLGKGAYGCVYKDKDGKSVTKVMKAGVCMDEEYMYTAMSRLQGKPYVDVMPVARGKCQKYLERNTCDVVKTDPYFLKMDYRGTNRVSFSCTKTMLMRVAPIAGFIRTLHRAGYSHNDIKPENIVSAPKGLSLIDIGLMTRLDSRAAGKLLGYPSIDYPIAPVEYFASTILFPVLSRICVNYRKTMFVCKHDKCWCDAYFYTFELRLKEVIDTQAIGMRDPDKIDVYMLGTTILYFLHHVAKSSKTERDSVMNLVLRMTDPMVKCRLNSQEAFSEITKLSKNLVKKK